jgi:hypothetical protein
VALTDMQQTFVREYLVDMNASAAYVRAGYTAANEQVAASSAFKLLRNAQVASAIDEAQCARMDRLDLDADGVVARFRLVYLRAMTDRGYGAAIKALDNISKFLGLYERDNTQRKRSPEDVAALRVRLEMMGVDFTRKNFPAYLVGPKPGEQPKIIPDAAVIVDDDPQQTR